MKNKLKKSVISPLSKWHCCSDQEFAEWAFGKSTWNAFLKCDAHSLDLMESWNVLHGKDLLLSPDMCILDSMKLMKKLWEKRNAQ